MITWKYLKHTWCNEKYVHKNRMQFLNHTYKIPYRIMEHISKNTLNSADQKQKFL